MRVFEIEHESTTNQIKCVSEEDYIQLVMALAQLKDLNIDYKLKIIERGEQFDIKER